MRDERPFAGFPPRGRTILLPAVVFSELLPAIGDVAELKVTLHLLWRLAERRTYPRFVRRSELETDRLLLTSLSASGPPLQELRRGLRLALTRGTFLEVAVVASRDNREETLYFLNSEHDRAIIRKLERGELDIGQARAWRKAPPDVQPRPTIFHLYEQNIGLLTPLLADELRAAEEEYPQAWIEDAFRLAVALNRRNWRYIARILERWRVEGKDDGAPGTGPTSAGWERYFGHSPAR